MSNTTDIVQRLWGLCNVLRDDGITYHQYLAELTLLLFLKMAEETRHQEDIPEGWRWNNLVTQNGNEQLTFYRQLLEHLATHGTGHVPVIYKDAQTLIRQPRNLKILLDTINALDWYDAREEGLGEMYEGLLQKNANEKKSGAGQYFTPRVLIDTIVKIVKPQPGEIISDPAAGTLSFLVAADRYIKKQTDGHRRLTPTQAAFQAQQAFYGVELVPDTHRLALVNALLHDISGDIMVGDTLSPMGKRLPPSDLILTNPPFGTKKGGIGPERDDFTFHTSNKQFAFLQHIYRNLKPKGRAAVVLPDNVLFEDNRGQKIRTDLMDKCNLHTILRLPTGIFYAPGVKTNVLFFQRGVDDVNNTTGIWYYDLRTNMPTFGKRNTFSENHLTDFIRAFGPDPNGQSKRKGQGTEGRFRYFSRDEIAKRNDNLDITWLRDKNVERAEHLPAPHIIASEMMEILNSTSADLQQLMNLLETEQ